MTKDELARANLINEQLEALNNFLNNNKQCWGILRFFATPKQRAVQVTLRTSYGWRADEISASERLSANIVEAIKQEVSLLQDELSSIGKE